MLNRLRTVALGLVSGFFWAMPAVAQTVTPTVGSGHVGTTIDNNGSYTITGGTQRLNTLFHSFEDFSPETLNVLFELDNTQSTVDYVIGRVTGNNISSIDSELSLTGGKSPDLFLINPNGITFGQNASLSLPGSFVASTAEAVLFNGGLAFSANNPVGAPLLTVSVPTGLQMGQSVPQTTGHIQVNNVGHDLSTSPFGPVTRGATLTGLETDADQTLALIGHRVSMTGGLLSATNGKTVIGAIASPDQVSLATSSSLGGWQVGYDNITQFGDITLGERSLINAGDVGAVHMRGHHIYLQDGSIVFQENTTSQAANRLQLQATDTIEMTGQTTSRVSSGLISNVRGEGQGGDISLVGDQIVMKDNGGDIRSFTFAEGMGGNIEMTAGSINVQSGLDYNALIHVRVFGDGNGGDIIIETDTLTLQDSSIINNVNGGTGSAGKIKIHATQDVLLGPNRQNATLVGSSAVRGDGNAGGITITTPTVTVQGGAVVSSSTYGAGRAGQIEINASDQITVAGEGFNSTTRGVANSSISTSGLLLSPFLRTLLRLPDTVTGDGGDILLNTNQLFVTDKGRITVRHEDQGNAGSIQVTARQVYITDEGDLLSSSRFGAGGNIQLNLQDLLFMRNRGLIDSESFGTSDGGNITINAPVIIGIEDSDIVADAITGNGGNIAITAQSVLGLEFREERTTASDITASSDFGVNGTVEINNLTVDPGTTLVVLPEAPADADSQIATACAFHEGNQFIASGRGGLSVAPTIQIIENQPWSDVRALSVLALRDSVPSDSALRDSVPSEPQVLTMGSATASGALENSPEPTRTPTEANEWHITEDGQVELLRASNTDSAVTYPANCLAQTRT